MSSQEEIKKQKELQRLQKIASQLEQKKQLKMVNLSAGKGGFGDVMIVQDPEGKQYAIKSISLFDGVDDVCEQKKSQAEDEAKLLKNCNHEHIVKYEGEFQIGFNYFILMEKCEMSLQDFFDQKQRLNRDQFLRIAFETLLAIDYLHQKNLVLRDVSLKNILLDQEQKIKLCDFGLTKQIDPVLASQAFLTSNAKGVCFYFPPECLFKDPNDNKVYQTKEGDIWAFGICLYLLAGATFMHILSFVQGSEEYQRQNQIDQDLNNLIKFILERNPKNRPTANQILTRLFGLLKTTQQDVEKKEEIIFDEKIQQLKNKIQQNPKDSFAYCKLGNEFLEKQMIDEAIKHYQKAIKLKYNDEYYHFCLGNAYKGNGMLEEAIKCYKQSIDFDVNYVFAYSQLGAVYFTKGMLDDSLKCYYKSIELNDTECESTYYFIGSIYYDKGMMDNAMKYYRISITKNPNYIFSHIGLGNIFLEKKLLNEALECYLKVVELRPDDSYYLRILGEIYEEFRMFEEAISYYSRAVQINPDDKISQNMLNRLKEKQLF